MRQVVAHDAGSCSLRATRPETMRGPLLLVRTAALMARDAFDVVAGVATFAIATAISALSIAFLASATEIIDAAMKPMQTSAAILRVTEHGGQFTVPEARAPAAGDRRARASRTSCGVPPVVDEIDHRDIFEILTLAESRVRGSIRCGCRRKLGRACPSAGCCGEPTVDALPLHPWIGSHIRGRLPRGPLPHVADAGRCPCPRTGRTGQAGQPDRAVVRTHAGWLQPALQSVACGSRRRP